MKLKAQYTEEDEAMALQSLILAMAEWINHKQDIFMIRENRICCYEGLKDYLEKDIKDSTPE